MKSRKITLVFFIFTGFYVFSQNNIPLSYSDFIKNIEQANPSGKRAANFDAIGDKQYRAALGGYDPQLELNYKNKFFSSKNYYSYIEGGLKQQLFASQYLKAGYEYGQGAFANPELTTPVYGIPFLGFETALIQGLYFDKRRADVLKAKQYKKFYKTEKDIQLNELFYNGSSSYSQWAFSQKQQQLYAYFLELASQRLEGINALAIIGERAAADTIEASILYQSRQLDYNSSKIELQQSTIEAMYFYWTEKNQDNFLYNYTASDSLDVLFDKFKGILARVLENDSLNNPLINQYNIKQSILEIEKRFRKELIKPVLNVNYNLISANDNSSFAQFSANNYKWGANLSFPLFLRTSRNNYKIASLEAYNNKLELDVKNRTINYKVNLLKENISLLSVQLLNAAKNVNYSRLLLEAEKLKFNAGESSLFLLNTRESRLLEAELKLAEYKLKFIKSALNVIYLKGSLNYKL